MAEKAPQDTKDSPSVSWNDAIRFIRQLSHDLRNDLNAIELQSAYIAELEKNEELQGEIKRLREMVSGLASTLRRLSRDVEEVKPNLISYRATDFMEDLRRKIDDDFPKQNTDITWEIQPGHAMLNVDPQLLQEVFTELFAMLSGMIVANAGFWRPPKSTTTGSSLLSLNQRTVLSYPRKIGGANRFGKSLSAIMALV